MKLKSVIMSVLAVITILWITGVYKWVSWTVVAKYGIWLTIIVLSLWALARLFMMLYNWSFRNAN
jgi:hypothetical protein